MKTYKSKYDLDNEYRLMLKSLMEDAQAVCRQYEYGDFADGDYSVSYKRNKNWFLEGLVPRLRDEKQGVKERDKLRKGTKNYYAVYRDEQGLIKKAVSYVGGEADVTYFAVYKGNKRYLLPFSDDWQGRYPTYTIVAEYSGCEIIKEYMADDSQIVYYGYEKRSEEEYRVEVINYIPNGAYPVNAYEVFTVSLVNGIEYSDERSYSWYDEFNCQRKGLPYMQELPEHMIAADNT